MSNSKLYVGNLSFKTTEDELRTHFGQFGSVTDVYVAMDKMTGRSRGFGFVEMENDADAAALAEAVIRPKPGMLISRRAVSSFLAIFTIVRSSRAIASSRRCS